MEASKQKANIDIDNPSGGEGLFETIVACGADIVVRDNLPSLVDPDLEIWTDYLGDYVNMWLRNCPRFFEDQKHRMVCLALYPYLFGITDNLPRAWIRLFISIEDATHHRVNKVEFSESEIATFEMAELIFKRCADLTVKNMKDLKEVLNFIHDIEERSDRTGQIDVNYALEKLVQLKVFPSIWNPIRRSYEKKKRQTHQLILYFFKTIHTHIVSYGRDGQDKLEIVRKTLEERTRKHKGAVCSSYDIDIQLAQEALSLESWFVATRLCNKILKCDPLNHLYCSTRAECNVQLKKFGNALPDCWRVLVLQEKYTSKPFYQAALCYFELGYADKALEMNTLAVDLAADADERRFVLSQTVEIEKVLAELKKSRARAISESEGVGSVKEEKVSEVFSNLQCEASTLYENRRFSEAAEKFHETLEMIGSHGLKALDIRPAHSMFLNLSYGLACVHTGTFSNLQNAIEKFKYVISEDEDFSVTYYGLGLAYKSLNRFPEALAEFQLAKEKRKKIPHLPQIESQQDEPDQHFPTLEDLIQECKHPPKPDAICRFHSDSESSRTQIYKSDPDYKGFIRLLCNCKCCIEFHSNCWKTYRHKANISIDKEVLYRQCLTPNCWGVIINIFIFKPDTQEPRVFTAPKRVEVNPNIRKPIVKMKTTNPLKLQKKAEKKQIRRDRREEDRQKKAEDKLVEEGLTSETPSEAVHYGENKIDLRNLDATMVLIEKEPDALVEAKAKQKTLKPKKKKEKTKQVLTFDLQFSADKEKELLGADSVDCETNYENQPGVMGSPPRVATQLASVAPVVGNSSGPGLVSAKPSLGNGLLPLPLKLQPTVDVFLQNLVECFVTVLQGGPADLDSGIVRDILAGVPSETRFRVATAGGIAAFLSSQPQFIVAGGKVGLAKGGPGLLSSGGGAGLLDTPSLPVSPAPWSNQALSQKKGLLGSHPQQSITGQLSSPGLLGPQPAAGKLNPSAEEFVPGPRKNSLGNISSTHSGGDGGEAADNDEQEEEDGEFVTVTHKKSSHSKSLKLISGQNGINTYTLLNDKRIRDSSSSLDEFFGVGNSQLKSTVTSSGNKPSQPLTTAAGDVYKNSSSSSSSSNTNTAPPVTPFPVISNGIMDGRRKMSDASSTLSEDMRPFSPASNSSLLSQGSSNSNPSQGAVCPPQPLKASGLNLPKKSKRSCLREKLASRSSNQSSASRNSPLELAAPKVHEAMTEVDDITSVGSSTSDKDSVGGLDPAVLTPGAGRKGSMSESTAENYRIFPVVAGDVDKDSNSVSREHKEPGSIWNGGVKPKSSLPSMPRDQMMKSSSDQASAAAPQPDPFFPGMYDYGSSLDPSSVSEATETSSSLQTLLGQGRRESRVLRNLGLSQSPSPPLAGSQSSTESGHTGHIFDSSGNLRPAMADHDLEPGVSGSGESSQVKGLMSSVEWTKFLTEAHRSADPWAKPGCDSFPRAKFEPDDALYGGGSNFTEDPYFPSYHYEYYSSTYMSKVRADSEASQSSASEPLKPSSSLSSTPGMFADRNTWSPLISDSLLLGGPSHTARGHHSWLDSFDQQQDREDPGNVPVPSEVSKTPGLLPIIEHSVSQPTRPGVIKPRAVAAAVQTTAVVTATASVNTDLTGDKLKSLQQRFYDLKEERDSLRVKVKVEQEEKELEKNQREALEKRVAESNSIREKQLANLEQSRRHVQALEAERDSLTEALKEVMDKARQLDEVKGHLQREAMKVKTYEKQILNLHLQASLNNLEMRRKEACGHVYRLDSLIHKIRNCHQVEDTALTAKHQEWEVYVKACEGAIEQVIETCRIGMQALEDGGNLEDILPLEIPQLPPLPKPPSEQSLLGHPQTKAESTVHSTVQPPTVQRAKTEPKAAAADSSANAAEDDESAFLKMVFKGAAAPKQDKTSQPPVVEPPPPLRFPPGLPRRPLSQGPVPLQLRPSASSSSLASSSSSSSSSSLASIKLPSGQQMARPSLASIAATMVPQTGPRQSQAPDQPKAAQPQQLPIFERLVEKIQDTFPDHTRSQIQKLIKELRRDNGGSLANFSFDNLAHCITERIVESRGENTSRPTASGHQLHREAAKGENSGGASQATGSDGFSEMTCTICHEDTEPGLGQSQIRVLDCGHRFHEDCIQSWLRVNHTCPNCRSHSLLEEDFPSLRKLF